MMDIIVKTLDGQNRHYTIPESISVKGFKERISNSINIPASSQRLIFQGRVMQDEKLLKDYDVHGKVIHVVQQQPPVATTTAARSSDTPTTTSNNTTTRGFNFTTDMIDLNQIRNMVEQAVNNLGDQTTSLSTRTSVNGSSVDVHIDLGIPVSNSGTSFAARRLSVSRAMLTMAQHTLTQMESTNTQETPMDTSPDVQTPTSGVNPTSTSAPASSGGRTASVPVLNTTEVAAFLGEMFQFQTRFQPLLERYRNLLAMTEPIPENERAEVQSVVENVTRILHYMSHCYHSLSDMTADLSRPPPHFMAVPVPNVATAIIQQSFPIEVEVADGTNTTSATDGTTQTTATSTLPHATLAATPTTATDPAINPPLYQIDDFVESFIDVTQGDLPHGGGNWSFAGIPSTDPNSVTMMSDPVMFMGVTDNGVEVNGVTTEVTLNVAPDSSDHINPTATTGSSTTPQTDSTPSAQTTPTTNTTTAASFSPRAFPMNPTFMGNMMQMINSTVRQAYAGAMGAGSQIQMPFPNNTGSPRGIFVTPAQPDGAPINIMFQRHRSPAVINPLPLSVNPDGQNPVLTMPPASLQSASTAPPPSLISTVGGVTATGSTVSQTTTTSSAARANQQQPIPIFDPFLRCSSYHVDPAMQQQNPIFAAMASHPQFYGAFRDFTSDSANQASSASRTPHSGSASTPVTASSRPANAQPFTSLRPNVPSRFPTHVSSAPTSAAPPSAAPTTTSHQVLTEQNLASLVSDIQQSLLGHGPSETFTQLTTRLSESYNLAPEGSNSDTFLTVTLYAMLDCLSLPDLLGVMSGQYSVLNSAQANLQEVLRAQLSLTSPATPEAVAAAVDKIMMSDFSHESIASFVTGHSIRPRVNVTATLQKFIRAHLTKFLLFVLKPNNNFGEGLVNMAKTTFNELHKLGSYVLTGGSQAVDSLIRAQANTAFGGVVNSNVQFMMDQFLHGILARSVETSGITEADILKYVIMDVDTERDRKRQKTDGPSTASQSTKVTQSDRPIPSTSASAQVVANHSATTGESQDWKSLMPAEWVSIINDDITRQQNQPKQKPHSDAYLNGLPIKRRKMTKQPAEDLTNPSQYLTEAVKCAIESAKVEPLTNIDRVVEEVADDTSLHMAHEEFVHGAVGSRLSTDEDYNDQQFENIQRVFKKSTSGND